MHTSTAPRGGLLRGTAPLPSIAVEEAALEKRTVPPMAAATAGKGFDTAPMEIYHVVIRCSIKKNSSSSSLQSYNSSFKLNESDYKSFCDRNNTSDCNTLTYKNDSNVNTTHTESSTQPIRKFVKSDNDDFDLNKTI